MRAIAVAGLLSLSLLLSGCQALLLAAKPESGLAVSRQAWEHRAPGCEGKDCALINIDLQTFNELPELLLLPQAVSEAAGHGSSLMATSLKFFPLPTRITR